jgi:hypothetical protein
MPAEVQRPYPSLARSLGLKESTPRFLLQDELSPVAVLCACFPDLPLIIEAIGANAQTAAITPVLTAGTYEITIFYSLNAAVAGGVESFARVVNGAAVQYHIFKTIQGFAAGSTPLQVVRVRLLLRDNDQVQINANGTGVGSQCNMSAIVQPV